MNSLDLLIDAFGRVGSDAHRALDALDGVGGDPLHRRLDPDANTVAWLVWHLTRVQDDHVADLAGTEQVLTAGGWSARLGLPLDDADIGYGHSSEQVAKVRVDGPDVLRGYLDATLAATVAYLRTLDEDDLDAVIDDHRDPPVTRGVRLVSVVDDDIQHAGQAALLAGTFRRAGAAGPS